MRTIKFRGQGEDGKWLYGDLRQRLGYWPAIIEPYPTDEGKVGYREIAVKEETVGQFSGRRDKDGHDIYEGDIVKRTSDINGDCPMTGVIRYSEESAQFVLTDEYGKGHPLISKERYSYGKVIFNVRYSYTLMGNIHENPELLKSKQ